MSLTRRIFRRLQRELSPPPPYSLVFIHIPKTGGMSLREVLLRHARRRPTFWLVDPVKDTAWLRSMPPEKLERFFLVEGHFYFGLHEVLPRPCAYITMLRDPVERILSYYSHIRERSDHHLHQRVTDENLSLAECIRRGLTVELDNFMVRALCSFKSIDIPVGAVTPAMLSQAKAHLESIAFLGITEHFEQSVDHLCQRLGWGRFHAPRVNTTAARLHQHDLSPADLDLVRHASALDAELYAHALTLFETRSRGDSTLVPRREVL